MMAQVRTCAACIRPSGDQLVALPYLRYSMPAGAYLCVTGQPRVRLSLIVELLA